MPRSQLAPLRVVLLGCGTVGSEVYRLLGESRILAAPSRTAADGDSEGLPTTVVEAMALGVPVVSTRHSGIPEAVVDGVTGLLGPNGAGKTTLLSALLGRLPLESGRQSLGPGVRLGEVDQARSAFTGTGTVVEVVEYQGREQAAEARTETGERLHLRSDHRLAPGDAVSLSVPTERLLVYPMGDEAPPSSSPMLGEASGEGAAPALAGRG